MNETTITENLDWDDLRLFLAVAREGGLAAASQKTGKSAPTLGRRMLALEQRLGNELFDRLPRGYVLTEFGRQLLRQVISLEDGIYPILSRAQHNPLRRVKISAGTWVTQYLCANAKALQGDLPVLLQFISTDHVLDIGHRETVIGIRNKRPNQTTLAGQAINQIRFATYAVDESVQTWATVIGTTPSALWVQNLTQAKQTIEVSNPRNALDLALGGIAKTVLPKFIGDNTAGLQQVSEEIPELEHRQWLVSHHEDRHFPEVRQVLDLLYPVLNAIGD